MVKSIRLGNMKRTKMVKSTDRVKRWKKQNPEKNKEHYDKWNEKNRDKIKQYGKEWRELNKEYFTDKYHKRKHTGAYKKAKKKGDKAWRNRNPERVKMYSQVRKIIKIPKGTICCKCDERLADSRHHPNYNKPFEVELVCNKCHCKIHTIIRRLEKQNGN